MTNSVLIAVRLRDSNSADLVTAAKLLTYGCFVALFGQYYIARPDPGTLRNIIAISLPLLVFQEVFYRSVIRALKTDEADLTEKGIALHIAFIICICLLGLSPIQFWGTPIIWPALATLSCGWIFIQPSRISTPDTR